MNKDTAESTNGRRGFARHLAIQGIRLLSLNVDKAIALVPHCHEIAAKNQERSHYQQLWDLMFKTHGFSKKDFEFIQPLAQKRNKDVRNRLNAAVLLKLSAILAGLLAIILFAADNGAKTVS